MCSNSFDLNPMSWDYLMNDARKDNNSEDLIPDKFNDKKDLIVPSKYPFDFDYFNVSSCSAVRAMQDKTQVFAFSSSEFTRTRLTHSLEVSSAGEMIISMIDRYIKYYLNPKNKKLDKNDKNTVEIKERFTCIQNNFLSRKEDIISVVKTAGLLHDIGNPPFGHKGEESLNKIVKNWIDKKVEGNKALTDIEKQDLYAVEGNAQMLRFLLSADSIKEMKIINPTYAVLSCLMKYTCCDDSIISKDKPVHLHKKGFYLSEEKDVKKIFEELHINPYPDENCYVRHPLAFILEAADDIAYRTADFEDAFFKGFITEKNILETLEKIKDSSDKHISYFKKNLETLLLKLDEKSNNYDRFNIIHAWTTQLKIQLIYCTCWSFCANYNEIMGGTYSNELLLDEFCFHKPTMENLKLMMEQYVYNSEQIKLQDSKAEIIIEKIWDYLTEFIDKGTSEDFETDSFLKLPYNLRVNLKSLSNKNSNQDHSFLYYEIRLIIDFISSLSDEDAKQLAEWKDSYNMLG